MAMLYTKCSLNNSKFLKCLVKRYASMSYLPQKKGQIPKYLMKVKRKFTIWVKMQRNGITPR